LFVEHGILGMADEALARKQQERANAFNARTRRVPTTSARPNALTQVASTPTVELTTAGITVAKQAATPAGRDNYASICIDVRVGNRIETRYGNILRVLEVDTTMPGMNLAYF
jgi:hypothetical protein